MKTLFQMFGALSPELTHVDEKTAESLSKGGHLVFLKDLNPAQRQAAEMAMFKGDLAMNILPGGRVIYYDFMIWNQYALPGPLYEAPSFLGFKLTPAVTLKDIIDPHHKINAKIQAEFPAMAARAQTSKSALKIMSNNGI